VFGSFCPVQPANNLVVSGSETIAL
jgi:hypothetical protein